VEVVGPQALRQSDPFVLLMDDRLEMARRRQIGGAHPHAGLETVTLVLEGSLHDRDEGALSAGDLVWMTAGRGIIHNEAVEVAGRARILQLWIGLPARLRTVSPGFEVVRRAQAPVVRQVGAQARLYSGASGTVQSPTRNQIPVTLLDLSLEAGGSFRQALPAAYNGFVYVLEGNATVGGTRMAAGQVGWLAPAPAPELLVEAGESARVVLYAGLPHGEPLVQQGPFVAGSRLEIAEFHRGYRAGQFTSMSELARRQRAERQSA
jgi:redox-sensitive bicupin YhaK (pirin superfamily)